jgi:hypothetical protein
MSNHSFPPYPRHSWLGMETLLFIHTDDYQPFMCILAYFRRYIPPVLYVQTYFNTKGLLYGIFILMRRIKITITLREDLVFDFRWRGLSNLSAVMEELLSAFLSSIPSESTKRTSKETLELVRNFLNGRSTQAASSSPQELFQQFMAFLQSQSLSSTSGQPQQTFRPQPQQTPTSNSTLTTATISATTISTTATVSTAASTQTYSPRTKAQAKSLCKGNPKGSKRTCYRTRSAARTCGL